MDVLSSVPELRPEIVFIFDLVRQLTEGRIKIPRFQRPFVWRRQQMVDLLDSIYKQYPIGSLLAWETDVPIVSLSSIGPVRVDKREGSSVYLLDGHQRLSTIAGALIQLVDEQIKGDEDPSRWRLFFNAKERIFEHLDFGVSVQAFQFPMTKILDTFDFLAECQRVMNADPSNGRLYVERIQEVARAFQNYKIPVIRIGKTGLTEAVEIFARLNSKGQAMTADQMVSALLYSQDVAKPFDLAGQIDGAMATLQALGFGELDRTVVLRSLLAAVNEDIYRTDWTRIARVRREELVSKLQTVIPRVHDSLERAAEFLQNELGVLNDRLLPYGMQMTILSSFFFAQRDPSQQQLNLLKRWFWVSSFSGWFGGANPSRVNALARDVIDNVSVERKDPRFVTVDLTQPALPIPRSFDMRSARTRALLLVLLSLHPLDRHGREIVEPENLIRLYGPGAVGYVANTVHDRDLARSPANRIIRESAVARRGQARTWLLACAQGHRAEIWTSHAIPLHTADLLNQSENSAFIRARLDQLISIESDFMRDRGVTPPITDEPASAPVDTE